MIESVRLTEKRKQRLTKLYGDWSKRPSASYIYDLGLQALETIASEDVQIANALLIKKAKCELGLK